VVLHGGGGSFKSQMKKADASLAHDDEAGVGEISFKPMRVEAAQQRLPLAQAIALMKEM
jgi:histidyl-tRNA synthetase